MTGPQGSEFWLCYKPFAECDVPVTLVNRGRAAVLRDTAQRAREAGFARVRVFSTEEIDGLAVKRTASRQLIGSIVAAAARESAGPVCYAGSGMPAMTVDDWAAVLRTIEAGVATTNRMFSCDWIGVPHGRLLTAVRGQRADNRFAQLVRDQPDITIQSFPRSARSLLDLDTPADLVVLKTAMRAGSLVLGDALQAELVGQRELDEQVRRAIRVFDTMTRPTKQLFVSGRVSGSDWAQLDRDTSCRVRVLSEERGLRTRREPVHSLLGALYREAGPDQFVEALSSMGDAMLWDTRPFLAHIGCQATRADRFAADLGFWTDIESRALRELVIALHDMPVLLGGHSLVSGGLLAAIDAAWTRRESLG